MDQHQVERHFTAADLAELYVFNPDILPEEKDAAKQTETGNGQGNEMANKVDQEQENRENNGDENNGKANQTNQDQEKEKSNEANDEQQKKGSGEKGGKGPDKQEQRPTLPLPKVSSTRIKVN